MTSIQFVTLVSSEGTEYVLPVAAARRSGFVTRILHAHDISERNRKRNAELLRSQQHAATSSAVISADADEGDIETATGALRLELPSISASVLDLICHFLAASEHSHQQDVAAAAAGDGHVKNPPLDFSSALAFFDPSYNADRVFVAELMMAADYLAC